MNALLKLQHDGHNSLDRVNERALYVLDKWCKELGEFQKNNPEVKIPNSSTPWVAAEYLRSHISDMRKALDTYYKTVKENV